jgi:hypothetical protein
MDIVDALELLYENAKAGATTAQGQHLTLAYARSLIRRKSERLMRWQDQADEIKIALVGRARPTFGFIREEDVVATLPAKRADAELKGSLAGVVALCGQ